MANSPGERKRGGAWWSWLLALLVLALVLWLLWSWFAGGDDEAVVPPVAGLEEPMEPAEPLAGADPPRVDQAVLLAASGRALHVGQRVTLTEQPVQVGEVG